LLALACFGGSVSTYATPDLVQYFNDESLLVPAVLTNT
jgi:hypothetical protein